MTLATCKPGHLAELQDGTLVLVRFRLGPMVVVGLNGSCNRTQMQLLPADTPVTKQIPRQVQVADSGETVDPLQIGRGEAA